MGQTDKPPSNLPEDSNVDEGAATLDRIERGLKETSRLVGDHLVWETIGDRASERAVEFLLDKR
jgi:trehalose utilization protein|tara:strand:+ start:110 stop:301 length:192 start_codon:yes stop_codon:yes gene_type:complete